MKQGISRLIGARFVSVAVGCAAVMAAGSAHAFDLGVGLIGTAGGNFIDKPDNAQALYPGFGGLTYGGGLMLDGRILDGLLGLEVDAIRSSDHGSGTYTLNGVDFKVKLGQGAWHVPILAKVTIPSPLVAPAFFVGPEIVAPSSASGEVTGPGGATGSAPETASTYVMLTGGLGVEIKVPLPVLDLRIPIGLRASYNPSVSSKAQDRFSNNAYRSEWKYAVNLTAGAAIYF
jgi:hypothetical protein